MCASLSRVLFAILFAAFIGLSKMIAYAQQANYRSSVTETVAQCRFGTLLETKGNWHDENTSDQLLLEQVIAISTKLKAIGGTICDSEMYDVASAELRKTIVLNAKRQVACASKFSEAMRYYKLREAVYFSSKELEAENRIMAALMYANVRNDRTVAAAGDAKAFSESRDDIVDQKEHAKDAKEMSHIVLLMMENRKSAAITDIIKLVEEKGGDKIKDITKEVALHMSAQYLEGQLIDWQYRNGIADMSDASILECR